MWFNLVYFFSSYLNSLHKDPRHKKITFLWPLYMYVQNQYFEYNVWKQFLQFNPPHLLPWQSTYMYVESVSPPLVLSAPNPPQKS